MKKVKIGILGVGPRLEVLAECYSHHPQVEFTAFCDIAKDRAATVAKKYNEEHSANVKAFTCYDDMIKGADMEALIIGIDPDKQVAYAVDAMERGIHVMTEVPAAYTIEECRQLVDTVEKTGVKYMLAEQTRYWNFFEKWRQMNKNGEFGKIYYAEGEYLHYEPLWDMLRDKETFLPVTAATAEDMKNPSCIPSWRYYTFMQPIFYLPHELSPLLSITGGRIEKVSCVGTRRGSYDKSGFEDVCDMQCALMYNSNDTIFSLRAGFTTPHGHKKQLAAHWYQIKGSLASAETARTDLESDGIKLFRADSGWELTDWGTRDNSAPEHIRNAHHGGSDFYPIAHFIDAIVNDKTPVVDVYTAVETAAPAIIAAESARKGGVLLEVPDFRKKQTK